MSETTRGQAIKHRRVTLGIPSVNNAHELSKKLLPKAIDRVAITKAEADDPSVRESTYDRLNALYDLFAEETGQDTGHGKHADGDTDDDRFVTFTVTGIYGAESLSVRGPVEKMADLEAAVARILRGASGSEA